MNLPGSLCGPRRVFVAVALTLFANQVLFGQNTCPAVNFYSGQALNSYSNGQALGFADVMGGYTGYAAATDGSSTTAMPQLLALLKPCYPNPNRKTPPADGPVAPSTAQPGQLVALGDLTGSGSFGAAYASGFINGTYITTYLLNISSQQAVAQNYSINGSLGDAVVLADFNGHHIPDVGALTYIQSGSSVNTSVVLLFGNGDGTFQPPVYLPTDQGVTGISVADLNGDGHPDLILSAATAEVWLGNGDGTFQPPTNIGPPAGQQALNALSAAVGDVNGDGKLDIVFGTAAGLAVALGSGSGTFQTPVLSPIPVTLGSTYVVLGDFNHDGILDAAATSPQVGIEAWTGKGDGTFILSGVYGDSDPPWSLVLADLDGDGNIDILSATGSSLAFSGVTNTGDTLTVLYGNGDGTFLGLPLTPVVESHALPNNQMTSGDFNGDGKPDVAVIGSNQVQTLFGGGFQFVTGPVSNLSFSPSDIAAGDFNGDQKVDLATSSTSGITILNGAGDGTFSPGTSFTLSSEPGQIYAVDVNGDGKPDLVALSGPLTQNLSPNSAQVSVVVNQGSETFGSPMNYSFADPISAAFGDFNGDGHTDIAVVSAAVLNGDGSVQSPGSVSILLGTGDGSFQSAEAVANTSEALSVAAADLNGDGKADLIVVSGNEGTWSTEVFLGSASGVPTSGQMLTNGFGPGTPVIADFNGDGEPDLLIPYCCGVGVGAGLRIGNGDGTFGPEIVYGNLNSIYTAIAADFNGDGKPDLAGHISSAVLLAINASQTQGALTTVTAAGFSPAPVASDSIVALFGSDLATSTASASSTPLPAIINGTSASITDSTGASTALPLFFVSPGQVNAYIPPAVTSGAATVSVMSGDGTISTGSVQVANIAPGVFLLNSSGLAAAQGLRVVNNTSTYFPVYQLAADSSVIPAPIDLSQGTVYLVLYTTGVRHETTLSQVTATVGGVSVPVLFSGAQPGYVGLDQVNVQLPASLAGKGNVQVTLSVGGVQANVTNVTIE